MIQIALVPDFGSICDIVCSLEQVGDICEIHHTNPYHGALSFDNLMIACIPVMQMATVSSWQEVMHITKDTTGEFATIYFIFGTVFGGYFLFNLFIAVLKSKLQIVTAVASQGTSVFNEIDEDGSGDLDLEELALIFSTKGVLNPAECVTSIPFAPDSRISVSESSAAQVFLTDEQVQKVFKKVTHSIHAVHNTI